VHFTLTMRFKASVASEKGPREEQQDSAQFFEQGGSLLALVCDGAGGHRGGSDASKVAVEILGTLGIQQKNGMEPL